MAAVREERQDLERVGSVSRWSRSSENCETRNDTGVSERAPVSRTVIAHPAGSSSRDLRDSGESQLDEAARVQDQQRRTHQSEAQAAENATEEHKDDGEDELEDEFCESQTEGEIS